MRQIGFNFEKISIERLKENTKELKISTNIDVLDIKEIKTEVLKLKEEVIQVKFTYIIKYEPSFAVLELRGNIVLSLTKEESEEILKEWDKKKISENFKMYIFNLIFKRSNVKALSLEEELNLPLHIPLPRLTDSKEK